jgi:plasmid stability protein
MATVTVRNLPDETVQSLKKLARARNRSMEQELRELIEGAVGDRLSVLRQIQESWKRQTRRPSAEEIQHWTEIGRP